jgi:hypothetical protein
VINDHFDQNKTVYEQEIGILSGKHEKYPMPRVSPPPTVSRRKKFLSDI